MPALISVIVELDSNINKVEFYLVNDFAGNPTATIENSGDYFNTVPNTILYGKVYMEDNYVINTVSSNPDEKINNLTTDTFNILATSNEQTITITSKSTVTYQIEQGTYYWIAQTHIDNFKDMGLGNNALNFKSNNEDFVSMNFDDETGVVTYVKSDGTSVTVFDKYGGANESYRQIIISTTQEVSEEFYQMMIENGLWETTQVNIVSIDLTTLSGWSSVTDGGHPLNVVAKADGYKDSEKSSYIEFYKSKTSEK